jgi:hypothetical protein
MSGSPTRRVKAAANIGGGNDKLRGAITPKRSLRVVPAWGRSLLSKRLAAHLIFDVGISRTSDING